MIEASHAREFTATDVVEPDQTRMLSCANGKDKGRSHLRVKTSLKIALYKSVLMRAQNQQRELELTEMGLVSNILTSVII